MYFSAHYEILQSEEMLNFDVYLMLGDNYVLYATKNQKYTSNLKNKLKDKEVQYIYISESQRSEYNEYVNNNFSNILKDPDVPLEDKSELLYKTTINNIRSFFEKSELQIDTQDVDSLYEITKVSIDFLRQDNAINKLGNLFSHDHKTYTHSVQVYVLTLALMNKYEFKEEEKIWTGVGSLLHDVGKLKIPSTILNKPGKLNEEEWRYMQHHPVLGVGCCSRIKIDQEAINSILFHHEKCDGTGYPVGLTKNNIPLSVRILSVCDVYDAITSDRPYAKKETSKQALQIMEREMFYALDMKVFNEFNDLLQLAELS